MNFLMNTKIKRGVIMKTLTFKGGLHPNDYKESTMNRAIEELDSPKTMIYPMIQHIGAPCEPLVKKGDRVLVCQKIGDSDAFVSSPVHSTVSGTITAVEKMPHPCGKNILSVVVENDFLYEMHPDVYKRDDAKKLSTEEKLGIIHNAGIVGLGGAAFPSHIKLNPPKDKKINCLIINGAECEPYLTSDYRVMLETPAEIFEGIKIMMDILGTDKCYIGIESNKSEAIKIMSNTAKKFPGTEIKVLKTKYPQGSEKQLIKAIIGKEVPSGGLPSDVGVVVNNIDTCKAIYYAIVYRQCVLSRVVTVAGDAVRKPSNFRVRIGTPFIDVLNAADCDFDNTSKVIMGGPMMGIAQNNLDVPVVKNTSAILAFSEKQTIQPARVNCVKCGECISRCPMGLMPALLNTYAKCENFEMLKKLNINDCIECGICSYTCQCRNNITQNIKTAKSKIRSQKN